MTASKTVALPLGDSTIEQTPNELHIIPSIRCIAPGQTQAYKSVSVEEHPQPFARKGVILNGVGSSPFSTIYPCKALTAPHVGFSSYFYMRTELPKVMLAGIVHHPPIRLMTNRALLRFRCYCYTSTARPI